MENNKVKTLITERLILRMLTEDDAENAFKNWTSDDEVSKYVRWSTHKNIEETKAYISNEEKNCRAGNYYSWGIVLKDENELIGAISAFPSDEDRLEIGYNISKKYWRNGYTTEALKEVLRYLINEKNIYKFKCSHAVLNPASGAVMKKAGFQYSHDDTYEKFDGSKKFECKVYYLDADKIQLVKPVIRKAIKTDSYNIANLIASSWQTAYKGLIEDKFLNSLSVEVMAQNWERNILNQDENDNIFVCEENNKILGVIRFGKPSDNSETYNSEIHALYVEPSLKGKGIGTKLFEFAKKYFIEKNTTNMIIWCLKNNLPSIKFYEKMGGSIASTRKAIVHNIEVEEVGFSYKL